MSAPLRLAAVALRAAFQPDHRLLIVTEDGTQASRVAMDLCRVLTDLEVPHKGDGLRVWVNRVRAGDPSVQVIPKGQPLYGARVDSVLLAADTSTHPEWWDRVALTRLAPGGQVSFASAVELTG